MSNSKIYKIVSNGAVAAIYFLLTFINPFSFTTFQIRLAEMLTLLCFFRKDYTIGVTIGCMLSNLGSNLGIIDVLVGGSATLLCCIFISYISPKLWIGALFTIFCNSIVIGLEISLVSQIEFYFSFLGIFVSEAITIVVGYFALYFCSKSNNFNKIIGSNQHLEWKW